MSSTIPERRQTPTERLHEVTLAALARRPAETEHTVDISRNARGIAQFSVAVRGTDLDATIDAAVAKFDYLSERYPYKASSSPVPSGKAGDAT